jgi:hypothetical protein
MIIGVLLLNKRYLMVEYLATMSAIAGLFLFSLADSKSSSTSLSLLGIGPALLSPIVMVLLTRLPNPPASLALSCCDMLGLALKSNLQEKLMSGTKASKLEVVRPRTSRFLLQHLIAGLMRGVSIWVGGKAFYCNLVGIPVIVPIMLLSGEFPTALTYSSQQPYFYFLMTVSPLPGESILHASEVLLYLLSASLCSLSFASCSVTAGPYVLSRSSRYRMRWWPP